MHLTLHGHNGQHAASPAAWESGPTSELATVESQVPTVRDPYPKKSPASPSCAPAGHSGEVGEDAAPLAAPVSDPTPGTVSTGTSKRTVAAATQSRSPHACSQ